MVIFDMNWTVGNYSYTDIRSDNTTVNATIRLFADTGDHMEENLPAVGSQFGVNGDDTADDVVEEEATSGLTPEKMLLYVGIFTGGSSVLLLGLLVMRKADRKSLDHVQDESE